MIWMGLENNFSRELRGWDHGNVNCTGTGNIISREFLYLVAIPVGNVPTTAQLFSVFW